jgi:hypothetical protein
MKMQWLRRTAPVLILTAAGLLFTVPERAQAQGGRGGAGETPKAMAPIDLTGYWVAIITEDWRYRMMVPAKGEFVDFPLTPEGRRVALDWDPAKDNAAGEQCRAYGAGGMTRMAGRLHITWQDDNTLKIDADTGNQTRLAHFGNMPKSAQPTWQGDAAAHWEFSGPARGRAQGGRSGSLRLDITNMKPGYLQRNGVPYSSNAVITAYYDVVKETTGEQYLVVTEQVVDPMYLARRILRSTHFRKQADATGWDPEPCTAP